MDRNSTASLEIYCARFIRGSKESSLSLRRRSQRRDTASPRPKQPPHFENGTIGRSKEKFEAKLVNLPLPTSFLPNLYLNVLRMTQPLMVEFFDWVLHLHHPPQPQSFRGWLRCPFKERVRFFTCHCLSLGKRN